MFQSPFKQNEREDHQTFLKCITLDKLVMLGLVYHPYILLTSCKRMMSQTLDGTRENLTRILYSKAQSMNHPTTISSKGYKTIASKTLNTRDGEYTTILSIIYILFYKLFRSDHHCPTCKQHKKAKALINCL